MNFSTVSLLRNSSYRLTMEPISEKFHTWHCARGARNRENFSKVSLLRNSSYTLTMELISEKFHTWHCARGARHRSNFSQVSLRLNVQLKMTRAGFLEKFTYCASGARKNDLASQLDTKPHMEEIGLKIITTAKISTSFHGSPRNFQTSFHGSSENFRQVFTGVNGSSRHSKEWTGKSANLEIQLFQV